jgi:hypothetical protein
MQLNKLDIGDGHVLHVSKAGYNNEKTDVDTVVSSEFDLQSRLEGYLSAVSDEEKFADLLPAESEAMTHPVALIWNVYDTGTEDLVETEVRNFPSFVVIFIFAL